MMTNASCRNLIAQVRARQPVIHCITNYVTANDVANIILAAGASPIMADGVREAEDIAAVSHGLVLNLGTLREPSIEAMLRAGRRAAELGHPVILDPVGAGASAFRMETAMRLLKEVPCTLIRGNASEIRALAGAHVWSRGVDADHREALTKENCRETAAMAQQLSVQTGAVVVMTGPTDLAASGSRVCLVKNGHLMMSRITGAGCMMDGVLASVLAAGMQAERIPTERMSAERILEAQNDLLQQVVYAVAAVGICGELAYEKTMRFGGGTGSFRMYFIDAMSNLMDETVQDRIRVEWDVQMTDREGKNHGF